MQRLSVLILESNESRRERIATALEQLGVYRVWRASTANAALANLRETPCADVGVFAAWRRAILKP